MTPQRLEFSSENAFAARDGSKSMARSEMKVGNVFGNFKSLRSVECVPMHHQSIHIT